MSQFNKLKTVLFLNPTGLKIINIHDKKQAIPLTFPPEYVNHQDVKAHKEFILYISSFIQKLSIPPQSSVLMLSSDLVFLNRIPLEAIEVEKITAEFFDNVPIESNKVQHKRMVNSDQHLLLATNRVFYQAVIEAFEQNRWSIEYVIPGSLWIPKEQEPMIDGKILSSVLKSTTLLKQSNFLDKDSVDQPNGSVPSHKRSVLIAFVVLLILIDSIMALAYFDVSPKSLTSYITSLSAISKSKPIEPTRVPTVPVDSDSKSTTDTETESIQTDLLIQVLNGSNIAGQAASVSALLTDMGFEDITIGNASSAQSDTTIAYSDVVNSTTLRTIEERLGEVFETVASPSALDDDTYEIVITTGRPKNE